MTHEFNIQELDLAPVVIDYRVECQDCGASYISSTYIWNCHECGSENIKKTEVGRF